MYDQVLVAGGSGFLGSNLCRMLVEQKINVICVDNLITGFFTNNADLIESPYFTFVKHDVQMPLDIDCDVIFNFACPASPPNYQADPINTIKTAFLGTMNLLDLAVKNNSALFQASTSEVYGDPLQHPQREEYFGNVNPIGKRACYDEGKRAAEALCFDYMRTMDVDVKVGRIFNTYGPKMDVNDGRVISNFIVKALKNEPLTIYGDGRQTRSFCYVNDLLEGILSIVDCENGIGPVNIGNPEEISLIELADLVCKLCNSKSKIAFLDFPEDDPKRRCPDINKILQLTNWKPRIPLEDGILKTINFFKSKLT